MIESSTPPLADLDGYRNVTDLLVARAAAAPDHVAFEVKGADAPVSYTHLTLPTSDLV